MKKFSGSLANGEVKVKVTRVGEHETLSEMVDSKLGFEYMCECYSTRTMNVSNKDAFIDAISTIIDEEVDKSVSTLKESLKYSFRNYYDQAVINEMKAVYENLYNCGIAVTIPQDVFAREDWNKIDGGIEVVSMNYMPDFMVDYVLYTDAKKYFDGGNKIVILYSDNGWTVDFTGDIDRYYTGSTPLAEKKKMFLQDNKEFIKSFYDSLSGFLGQSCVNLLDTSILEIIK